MKIGNPPPLRVAMVLFEGFELLDVFGPLEMFGLLGEAGHRPQLHLAALATGPVRSAQGPSAMADITLAALAELDVLLVPGGIGTRTAGRDATLLSELRRLTAAARFVGTICTGAALLATAGLLDGRRATTNKLAYRRVIGTGPRVEWIPTARWVEDGKFFTAAGVSAGMDMALALIARLTDEATADAVARCAEYARQRDSSGDPFAAQAGLS